jgi:hypothetical protein
VPSWTHSAAKTRCCPRTIATNGIGARLAHEPVDSSAAWRTPRNTNQDRSRPLSTSDNGAQPFGNRLGVMRGRVVHQQTYFPFRKRAREIQGTQLATHISDPSLRGARKEHRVTHDEHDDRNG